MPCLDFSAIVFDICGHHQVDIWGFKSNDDEILVFRIPQYYFNHIITVTIKSLPFFIVYNFNVAPPDHPFPIRDSWLVRSDWHLHNSTIPQFSFHTRSSLFYSPRKSAHFLRLFSSSSYLSVCFCWLFPLPHIWGTLKTLKKRTAYNTYNYWESR